MTSMLCLGTSSADGKSVIIHSCEPISEISSLGGCSGPSVIPNVIPFAGGNPGATCNGRSGTGSFLGVRISSSELRSSGSYRDVTVNVGDISITVHTDDGIHFRWDASGPGVVAVYAKGGQNGQNQYIYDGCMRLDCNLSAPNNNNGKPADIGHIDFCYISKPCIPAFEITSTVGYPTPGTAYAVSTGVQAGRLLRTGFIAPCYQAKSYPNTYNPGWPYMFDTYTFSQGCSGSCVRVAIRQNSGPDYNIFCSAYIGTYDPTNKSLNYLGDPGYAYPIPDVGSFEVFVPAQAKLVVVANTVYANSPTNYTIFVSGLCGTPLITAAAHVFDGTHRAVDFDVV